MFGKKCGLVITTGLVAIACGTDPSITEPEDSPARLLRPTAVFTVTNTSNGDPAPLGSLRWAIEQANATPEFDEIVFNIDPNDLANDCANGKCTIPYDYYPALWAPTRISGPPQPNTFDPPAIVIEGAIAVRGRDCEFHWLTITQGVQYQGGYGDLGRFVIKNNYIGTDPTGTVANPIASIAVSIAASHPEGIGGLIEGNVIGGGRFGFQREAIRFYFVEHASIINNRLGVDRTGESALAGEYLDRGILVIDGGGNEIRGNVIAAYQSMIQLEGAGGNVVQGNYLGVGPSGTSVFPAPPHLPYGVDVRSDDNVIGLTESGEGKPNVFGGPGFGVVIGPGTHLVTSGTSVLGNLFGMDELGDPLDPADRRVGISTGSNSEDITIGLPELGNRICCYLEGIRLSAFPTRVRILGNHFESMIYSAISVLGSTAPIQIGDVEPGAGNTIKSNGLPTASPGIKLLGSANGVTIRGNSIRDNGGLGIDLLNVGTNQYSFPDGPTPNDPGDDDDGGNGLQNYPVLTQATTGGGVITIHGFLNSHPNSTFRLEFFSTSAADPSGYGEGENSLGTVDVTSNAAGDAEFLAVLPGNVALGYVTSATATSPDGSTSEFSAVIPFVAVTPSESVQEVLDAIADLVASGDLATGPSKGLVAVLTQAIAQVEAGNDATAMQQLQAFVQLVGQFVASGKLDLAEGQALIDLATVAIQRLGG